MDPALAALLADTLTVAPRTGQDGYGVPTYGTVVSMKARVVYRNRLVRDSEGREAASRITAWVDAGTTVITSTDEVTLPDGTTPPILSVERVPDEEGMYYTRINFA